MRRAALILASAGCGLGLTATAVAKERLTATPARQ